VRLSGDLQRVQPQPAFLPERARWRALDRGAVRRIRLRSVQLMVATGPARPGLRLRLAVWVRRRFEALPLAREGPGAAARDLWGALALGIPPVRDEAFTPFSESGTIHTLVVSGLQVTLVMGAVAAFWRRLFRVGGGAACVGVGLLYCAVVGFTAPVWRGLFMGVAWAAGRGTGWLLAPVVALHGALLAWMMAHPGAGCEPGFLLAWLAMVGLLWAAEPLAGLVSPLLGRAALPFARVLAPWLTTLPLLALLHGGAPLYGVAANLALLPLVAVLAPAGLLLVLLPIPPAVAVLGGLLAWVGTRLVPVFARVVPLATGHLWPWIALVLGWILLAQLYARFRRCRWLCATQAGASLALLGTGGVGRTPPALSLEAIDIGQGDALLLRVPGGDATLVDTGPDPRAARRIVRVLSRRGVREPVHLVLTHPHLDHAGGWATLARLWPLASTAVPVMAAPDAGAWAGFGPQGGADRAQALRRGQGWRRGEAEFSVRWPPKPFQLRDFNMVSVVLRVRWRDRELWLMGDALAMQEQDLLALGDPGRAGPERRRLLKAGHHGSRSASSPAWVRALRPDLALVCAGRGNRFDHPHPEAMAALRSPGGPVFVTGTRQGLRVQAGLADAGAGWLVEGGDGLRRELPSGLGEDPGGDQGLHERQADPFVVGQPFPMGLRPDPVGHRQGGAAGDAGLVAGGEHSGQLQVLGGGQGGQAAGRLQGPGDPRRHRHRVGGEGERQLAGEGGRPAVGLGPRAVGPVLQHVQGGRQGGGGHDQVAHRQPLVIGAAGAHEQDPAGGQGGEQPGRGHRGGQGADPGAAHPPTRGRMQVHARQFGREGGEEEGGACAHRDHPSPTRARPGSWTGPFLATTWFPLSRLNFPTAGWRSIPGPGARR
jgi:competence protein ComEC